MITEIRGLHHVTSLASDAQANNDFFTGVLGLRRVKKTVNFDRPEVYHLYYGNERGAPGTAMTYFPFPGMARGRHGAGEVGTTVFAIPDGSRGYWRQRLAENGVTDIEERERFGEVRLHFAGPDGDGFALVEAADDHRVPWTGGDVGADAAIRGFHAVSLHLADDVPTAELLRFMGYADVGGEDGVRRLAVADHNGAGVVDLETQPGSAPAAQGAGSVHHVAFSVPDRAAQLAVRRALLDHGQQVTEVIDRDYFWAIYFRTPGGVLFEVATDEPGFDADEDLAHLGEALRLPTQHAHRRAFLEEHLPPIVDRGPAR